METDSKKPLVSVIMPAYNASEYIEQAVQSVLDQTYSNIELIVVDDGSSDDTMTKLNQFNDERLRIISQLNQGACVARNCGLQESKGEFIKFVDSDDIIYPEALATQVQDMLTLAENEEVFGDFDYIDADGNVFYHSTIDAEYYNKQNQDEWLMYHWKMVTSCPLHRKELLKKIGGFDVHLRGGQEGMLHLTMSFAGVRFVYRSGSIYGYRIHQDPNRISIQRESAMPNFTDRVYYLDKVLSMVTQKYGPGPNRLTDYVVQRYYNFALRFFSYSSTDKGQYCLRRVKDIPHTKHIPKYCGSSRMAKVYVFLIRAIGYSLAKKLVDKLVVLFGLKLNDGKALNMLLYGPDKK